MSKFFAIALFVIAFAGLALANPIASTEQVKHATGLNFTLGGETFSFEPEGLETSAIWIEETSEGIKWGFNFTLPSSEYKMKISLKGKVIKTKKEDETFIISDKLVINFSDILESGLSVKLGSDKFEISGFNNSLVGQTVSFDPLVSTSTGTSFLSKSNQRKVLFNAKDDSIWISFVGNSSCFLGSSYDNGTTWSFTNVSAGAVTDQYCSHEIDEYGNIWAYWTNSSDYLLSRVLGWNGTGWDLGSAFTVTEQDNVYGADFVMKYCDDSMGVFYTQPAGGSHLAFKACRNIADGGCNQTSASWNSTNQTLNSYWSILPVNWVAVSDPALDCVNGDFVGVVGANQGSSYNRHLLYGANQGNGNWVWNTWQVHANDTAVVLSQSILHNSTTVFMAYHDKTSTYYDVKYRECSAGSGCNVSSNWTTAITLDDLTVSNAGTYGVSTGLFNNTSPVVVWEQQNNVMGRLFNSTDWGVVVPLVDGSGTLRYPNLVLNHSTATSLLFTFANNTDNSVWSSAFDLTQQYIKVRGFDEQSGNQIYFNLDVYNSTSLTEYTNEFEVFNASSAYPQGSVWFDMSNTSYYGRSRLLLINEDTSADMKIYLLNTSSPYAIVVRFHIKSALTTSAISNASITIQKNIGGSIQTIGQRLSDFNGDALFYLVLNAPYFINVSATGFNYRFEAINPVQSDYTVALSEGEESFAKYYSWASKTRHACSFNATTNMTACVVNDTSGDFIGYELVVTKTGVFNATRVCDVFNYSASYATLTCNVTTGSGEYAYLLTGLGSQASLEGGGFIIGSLSASSFGLDGVVVGLFILLAVSLSVWFSASAGVLFTGLAVVVLAFMGLLVLSVEMLIALILISVVVAWRLKA